MNENLQNALVEILNKAVAGIDSSVAFMQAELPDVINQLLTWYIVEGVILSLTGIALVIPLLLIAKKAMSVDIDGAEKSSFWVECNKYTDNSIGFGAAMSLVASAFVAIFGLMILGSNFMTPIKIWIAPKIWLMEYAASLVK